MERVSPIFMRIDDNKQNMKNSARNADYRKRCYDSFVSKQWSKWIEITPDNYELQSKLLHKRFINILPKDKNAAILDIACGIGGFLFFLQKAGYKNAVGIDLSNESIVIANKMGIKNIEQADMFAFLPSHKEKFDMIIASHIIEHLSKQEILALLDLIYDSLKPNGIVLIRTPNATSRAGIARVFMDFTHETGFNPTSLHQVLETCNFSDIMVNGEEPVFFDLKSSVRAILWKCLKMYYKIFSLIEIGTGRGIYKFNRIYTPDMYAIATKTDTGKNNVTI